MASILPLISLGLSTFGAVQSYRAGEAAAEGSEGKAKAAGEAADLRRESGDLEQEAIKQRSAADIKSALYRRRVAVDNEASAKEAAQDAIDRGETDVMLNALQVRKVIGEQRATMAANGVELTGDDTSPDNLIADTMYTGDINAVIIRDNAGREAKRMLQAGSNFAAEALLLGQSAEDTLEATDIALQGAELETEADILATLAQIQVAKATASATRLQTFGSALGSAGQIGAQYSKFKYTGALD